MPGNVRPVANTGIDLELLQDWHEFCQDKGLHYNRVLDQTGVTLGEVRAEIAVAGRASPRHDGRRLGVVIDRPAELVVDHVNPRNSWNFTMRRSYVDLPHAFITKFQDQDNDYKEAERVIRRPGYEGDITITETLDQPGLTSAPIVYREGVRRFYEAIHRPDVFEVTQDGALRVATRGDKVALNSYVLSRVQTVGRVRYLAGSLIELDEEVTMEPGRAYGVRFRAFETPDDTIGNSVVRTVSTVPGKTTVLNLTGAGPMPELRELVHFGIIGADSFELLVTGLEPTEDGCTILRSVNAAPIIDTLTDAAEIPPWSSRVGEELDPNMLQPSAPRFTRIASGIVGVGELGVVEYMVEPGTGPVTSTYFEIEHRLGASGAWTTVSIPAANGGGKIEGYAQGETVQLRLRGLSGAGIPSVWTSPVTLVIGAGAAAIPAALDDEAINITTLLGGALIQLSTGSDPATTKVRVYRSTSPILNRETDAVGEPYAVGPMQSYSITLGDTTRSNLLTDGGFDNPAAWTHSAGWAIADSEATHTPGTVDDIGQALATQVGKFYRISFETSDITAGTVTPYLLGGSDRPGAPVSAAGLHVQRIQAVSGNTTIAVRASSAFDGKLDGMVAYLETEASLSQGTHYIWIEPVYADDMPGAASGPLTITIV